MKKKRYLKVVPWIFLVCLLSAFFFYLLEELTENLFLKITLFLSISLTISAVFSLILSSRNYGHVDELTEWFEASFDKCPKDGELVEAIKEKFQELKKRTLKSEEESSQLGLLFANMKELVVLLDSQKRIITMNRAAEEFLGFDVTTARRKPFNAVFRDMNLMAFVDHVFEDFKEDETEIEIYGGRDGLEKRYFFIRSVVVGGTQKSTRPSVLIVMDDRTNVKRLENIRREFVANVSHELKTPITAIKGYIETIIDERLFEKDIETAREFLSIIKRQGERLNRLVEDILLLSRIEERHRIRQKEFKKVSVKKIINSAIDSCKILAMEKTVEIKTKIQEDIPDIKADPSLLEQAITNLLTNAINYSPKGSEIFLSANKNNGILVFSIKDQGIGIAKEHQERIFERFYRVDKARSRKLGGTGLGLAIVKHIVKMHKGQIELESQPGKGSTFKIAIPIS